MRKTIGTLFICLAALAVKGQTNEDSTFINVGNVQNLCIGCVRDTVRIKDTVYVPVYLFRVTDTIPCQYLYEGSKKRIYKDRGFVLVQGVKVNNGKELQWAEQPNPVGVLDEKKRPVKKVIQIL